MLTRLAVILVLGSKVAGMAAAPPDAMKAIPPGVFRPFFKGAPPVRVKAFYMDQLQVTNSDFLAFTEANPEWQRGAVKGIFADNAYLKHWISPASFPAKGGQSPVTNVSFFAAKAYCKWKQKRLPTLAEWEHAAGASFPDAAVHAESARILAWYEKPSTDIPNHVGNVQNAFGVYDLNGLVWEWVADFNSVLLSDESRGGASDKDLFCGGGAQNSKSVRDYAAYMRYAFRSSLRSNYNAANLGFRCASER